MLRDLGSRDDVFIEVAREIRDGLVAVSGLSPPADYTTILMQGSGTFCLEPVITSIVPRDGTFLVVVNGACGHRMTTIAGVHHIPCRTLAYAKDVVPNPVDVEQALRGRSLDQHGCHGAL